MEGWGSGPRMIQDPELEEGEACYHKDDTSIDPDVAFSYLVRVSLLFLIFFRGQKLKFHNFYFLTRELIIFHIFGLPIKRKMNSKDREFELIKLNYMV